MKNTYQYPLALTQQFRFCGNPFRLDFYKGCDFGCQYCFANCRGGDFSHTFQYAEFSTIENYFIKAFEDKKETKNITIELLRNKVPIHVGGMSDPFQKSEWDLELNYKLIELSNKYNYPLIFSTKSGFLPNKYFEILNPKLHAFQLSLMGYDLDFIRKYERNTPSPIERIDFLKLLKSKGFWVGIRLQPIIDLEQAKKVCKAINGIADYITLEHLKIPSDNKDIKNLFLDLLKKHNYQRISSMRNFELSSFIKKHNIEVLKDILTSTPIGVGDNDLHYLSESKCCCGVDTIGENFNNYLKYNLTYFSTTPKFNEETIFIPKSDVTTCFNSHTRLKGVKDFKSYVEHYCNINTNFFDKNNVPSFDNNIESIFDL